VGVESKRVLKSYILPLSQPSPLKGEGDLLTVSSYFQVDYEHQIVTPFILMIYIC
jgi:hypothetical protein